MSISIQHLTKSFPGGRGIFDLSFEVGQGEVFGYLGPNGAGKSTTIRHLMGFMRPQRGKAAIGGLDCARQSADIQKRVGYLPGEIAFPDGMNGLQVLELLGGMRGMKDVARRSRLIERFQLEVKTPVRKMSKGMKQKVGLVAAFMHDPAILLLDEPTSGLDPLMQQAFISLILEEKRAGKTILMSSHIFDEIERTCDRVGIIKDGRLMAVEEVGRMLARRRKVFRVTFADKASADAVRRSGLHIVEEQALTLAIAVDGSYEGFIAQLAGRAVVDIDMPAQKLEELFMHYYDGKEALR